MEQYQLPIWQQLFIFWTSLVTGTMGSGSPQLASPTGSGSIYVHPQQSLELVCKTQSSVLSWRSHEYLNNNFHELAFTLNNRPGERKEFGDVVAVLDAITDGPIIQSTLRVVVSNVYETFTITCRDGDTGMESSKTFHKIDESAIQVAVENNETCINDDLHFECIVRDSLIIQWSSTEILGDKTITINCTHDYLNCTTSVHGNEITVFNNFTYALDGTPILMSSLTIRPGGLLTTTVLILTCDNVNIGISKNISSNVSQDFCLVTTSTVPELIVTLPAPVNRSTSVNAYDGVLLLIVITIISLICIKIDHKLDT